MLYYYYFSKIKKIVQKLNELIYSKEKNTMDDQGLFKVARYRPNESNENDDDDHASKKRKKKPKVNAMLERARLRAAKVFYFVVKCSFTGNPYLFFSKIIYFT